MFIFCVSTQNLPAHVTLSFLIMVAQPVAEFLHKFDVLFTRIKHLVSIFYVESG